ncbi:Uncharacterised protein [Vibrio cholerae]|nr:Uncharacterised protein [Vibrio cholerae]
MPTKPYRLRKGNSHTSARRVNTSVYCLPGSACNCSGNLPRPWIAIESTLIPCSIVM